MSDPVYDWYEWKRKQAEGYRERITLIKARLADESISTDQRASLERDLRRAERGLEAAQYVGD